MSQPDAASSAPITPPASWTGGLPSEAKFWDGVLSGENTRWKEGLERRFVPRQVTAGHRELIELSARGAEEVAVLDVGAGPCSVMGNVWEGRKVKVTAVDPLAEEYAEQLERAGRFPPVRTIKGYAERLGEQFAPGTFDFMFSHNALDHCFDPVTAIRQMILVGKPRACIQLEHRADEGEVENYFGLHQWNFRAEEGRFIIWNKSERHDMSELLKGTHGITCGVNENWLSVCIVPHGARG